MTSALRAGFRFGNRSDRERDQVMLDWSKSKLSFRFKAEPSADLSLPTIKTKQDLKRFYTRYCGAS